MIRIVNDHHGLGRPAFFCVVCRQEVRETGNVEWPVDEDGVPMGPFTIVCKEHSDALNTRVERDGLYLRWMDIHEFVFALLGKLTTGEDARQVVSAMVGIERPSDD